MALNLNPFVVEQQTAVNAQRQKIADKGTRYSFDNAHLAKGTFGQQLRQDQNRLGQMQALQTAFTDSGWRNALEGQLGTSLAARQNAAGRQQQQNMGQMLAGGASAGLLGSSVDAKGRGDLAAWLQGERQGAAQDTELSRQGALMQREQQAQSLLERILQPDQIQNSIWDSQLQGLNNQAQINQMLGGINQQRQQVTGQMLGGIFQGIGSGVDAGINRADYKNRRYGTNESFAWS